MITGVFVALHYIPHEDHAFESVERLRRDVRWGWLLHTLHANGASFLFIALYVHTWRSMAHGAYARPKELVWIFGVLTLFLMVAASFTGYVLPLSQMGGWAATVVTGLITAVPWIGDSVQQAILGGGGPGTATLTRFYVFHFIAPFLVLVLVFLHIWSLRTGLVRGRAGGKELPAHAIPFHPYHTLKGLLWLGVFLLAYVCVAFFVPDMLSAPEHRVPYDPQTMPDFVRPSWYLLPFYGLLKVLGAGINLYVLGGFALFCFPAVWAVFFRDMVSHAKNKPFCHPERKRRIFISGYAQNPSHSLRMTIMAWIFDTGPAKMALFAVIGAALMIAGYAGGDILPLGHFYVISAKTAGALGFAAMFGVLFFVPWLDKDGAAARQRSLWFLCGAWMPACGMAGLGVAGAMPPGFLWNLPGQIGAALYFAWFIFMLPFLNMIARRRDGGGT
jgi:quinol-cytochrome oxidoreductase complex cytochrome b subunit